MKVTNIHSKLYNLRVTNTQAMPDYTLELELMLAPRLVGIRGGMHAFAFYFKTLVTGEDRLYFITNPFTTGSGEKWLTEAQQEEVKRIVLTERADFFTAFKSTLPDTSLAPLPDLMIKALQDGTKQKNPTHIRIAYDLFFDLGDYQANAWACTQSDEFRVELTLPHSDQWVEFTNIKGTDDWRVSGEESYPEIPLTEDERTQALQLLKESKQEILTAIHAELTKQIGNLNLSEEIDKATELTLREAKK